MSKATSRSGALVDGPWPTTVAYQRVIRLQCFAPAKQVVQFRRLCKIGMQAQAFFDRLGDEAFGRSRADWEDAIKQANSGILSAELAEHDGAAFSPCVTAPVYAYSAIEYDGRDVHLGLGRLVRVTYTPADGSRRWAAIERLGGLPIRFLLRFVAQERQAT